MTPITLQRKRLYHRDIYLPRVWQDFPSRDFDVIASSHAIHAAEDDNIHLPNTVNISGHNIIEVESYKDTTEVKIVVRLSYNAGYDLIVVVFFGKAGAMLKTVWLNSKSDLHRTLDESKYYSPF